MGRRKRLNVPHSAGSSPIASNQGSTSSLNYKPKYPHRKIHSRCNSLDFMTSSAKERCSDDEFSTPIPSLHGNLVRSRYRRDPLEFYEPLEPIGEGSMGSVSKVRKRTEVIGGSARPDFVKSHTHSNKLFGWLPIPDFLMLNKKSPSDVSYNFNNSSNRNSGRSMNDSGGRLTPSGRNSPGTLPRTKNSAQSCFAMFCCPAQEKQNILEPIEEHYESGDGNIKENAGDNFLQGCFNGKIFRFCNSGAARDILKASARTERESTYLKKQNSLCSNTSSEGANGKSDTILDKTDYEEIERELERALKRSTSSLITYGHKDVVYALKSIHLDRVSSSEFMKELKNEVAILKQLDHPNIVKCYETFMYKGALYLVLELCSGSDLYSRDPYSEEQACKIVRAMFSAVAYMHSKRITHRDLKYENIMFASTDPDAEVKIIDFGLSKKYAADSFLHETVGTVYTMAPELLKGGYNEKVDVWSLGVIAFMLLSSSMPFYGKDRKQVIKKIVKGQYQFISRRWKTVSPGAKNFVIKMLQHSPSKRPSAGRALNDPWLDRIDNNASQETNTGDEQALLDKVQASIQTFAGYGKLKKLALMLIAYKSTSAEIGFLRQMFDRFDTKHDGELTMDEFKTVLEDYDYSDEELEYMFRAMDLDGAGMVHYSEFLAATFETHGGISEEQLAECFDRLDNDDSGYITKNDILDFLGEDIPQSYIDDIMEEADANNDNKISYDEFLALWDKETDDMMKQDKEDVKERRHRATNSTVSAFASSASSFASDISDDDDDDFFDELAVVPSSFENNEIAKMLDAPDTPTNERRVSATAAFQLEKDRSMRDASAREQSRRESVLKRDEKSTLKRDEKMEQNKGEEVMLPFLPA